MGLIVPTTIHPEREDQPLPYEWFVGIDWGAQPQQVSVRDRDRRRVGERVVGHDGASLARLADWLWTVSAGQPPRGAVAIAVLRGAMVEGLRERGSTSWRCIPNNATGSGIVTVWRGPRMTGAMPVSW